MKPVKADTLLKLDPLQKVEMIRCTPNPQQLVFMGGKNDYSELPIEDTNIPNETQCGAWVIEQLLANERGHWGPLEHPSITFSCSGFVHNVMVQARTHRVGISFDVQSQRYTCKRVLKVAEGKLPPQSVFYVRPPGFYTNRKGKKYEWSEDEYQTQLGLTLAASRRYAVQFENGVSEEHARDYLPQNIRQNFVVTFSLRSLLHFLDLRAKLDAQLEIQALCEAMIEPTRTWVPEIFEYYSEKRLHRARLAP
jgi:thymidylate synthase (FAD)